MSEISVFCLPLLYLLQTLKQKFNACTSLLAWFASLALLWHFILSFWLAIMKYSLSFVLMVMNISALFLCLSPHKQNYVIAWTHSMCSFFLICQLLEHMIDAESRICFTCSVLKHACYEPQSIRVINLPSAYISLMQSWRVWHQKGHNSILGNMMLEWMICKFFPCNSSCTATALDWKM